MQTSGGCRHPTAPIFIQWLVNGHTLMSNSSDEAGFAPPRVIAPPSWVDVALTTIVKLVLYKPQP